MNPFFLYSFWLLYFLILYLYELFFKDYPYKGETPIAVYNKIKNEGNKILKKTKNKNLDNLINSLLIRDPKKRINYEDYFNHPFFKDKFYKNILINSDNYIISEIEIEEDNQNVRIINSQDQVYREQKDEINEETKEFFKEKYNNEKEIKEICEIKINNEIIPFSYFYKFKNKGKYIIIYLFKNKLTKCNFIFWGCKSLTSIDLSNFNTQNATNMSYMFSGCKSLTNINLSNFNTQNVTNMSGMFDWCESLTSIDLSNFNTQNVIDMSNMFWGCKSLTSIDLSNFNTQNVTNMSGMFK